MQFHWGFHGTNPKTSTSQLSASEGQKGFRSDVRPFCNRMGLGKKCLVGSDFSWMNLKDHTIMDRPVIQNKRERYLYLGVVPSSNPTHSIHSPLSYSKLIIIFCASREMIQFLQSVLVLGLATQLSWASPQGFADSEAVVKERGLAPGDQYVFAFCPKYVIS
jgi:hypothetical protein